MATPRRLNAVPVDGPWLDGHYIRVSDRMGRADERFLSPDLQRQAMTRARSAAGPSVLVAEEVDIDVSGGSMDRPGLNRLLAMARDGRINRLWVLDLSRWARITTEGLAELERIEAAGCKVMSTAEQVDLGTPVGYFSTTLALALHKMKRDQIGETWQQVVEHRAARGLWHGPAPMGYRRDGGVLVPDPDVAPAMAEAFHRYAAGATMRDVARAVQLARGADPLQTSGVKRALGSAAYLGMVTVNGQQHDGQHEALVDRRTWDRVQRRLGRDAVAPPRVLAAGYALSGLASCAHCGGPLNHHRRSATLTVLECRAQTRGQCDGPGAPDIRQVEAATLDLINRKVTDLAADDVTAAEQRAARTRAIGDSRRAVRELEATRQARGRLAVDFARRVVDEAAYRLADAELTRAERDLLEALSAAGVRQDAPTRRDTLKVAAGLRSRWPDMTGQRRNQALRLVITGVTIRRRDGREPMAERLTPTWLHP